MMEHNVDIIPHPYLMVELCINRVIILDDILQVLTGWIPLQSLDHATIVAIHMDLSILRKYHGVKHGVLTEKAQDCVNAIWLC